MERRTNIIPNALSLLELGEPRCMLVANYLRLTKELGPRFPDAASKVPWPSKQQCVPLCGEISSRPLPLSPSSTNLKSPACIIPSAPGSSRRQGSPAVGGMKLRFLRRSRTADPLLIARPRAANCCSRGSSSFQFTTTPTRAAIGHLAGSFMRVQSACLPSGQMLRRGAAEPALVAADATLI